MKNPRSVKQTFYNFFTEKWLLTSIIMALAYAWVTVLQFFGRHWGLINSDGTLTSLAIVITSFFVICTTAYIILRAITDKHHTKITSEKIEAATKEIQESAELAKKESRMFKKALEETIGAARAKQDMYTESAFKKNSPDFDIPKLIASRKHIREVLNRTQNMVNALNGLGKNRIGVGLVYCNGRKWDWLDKINIDADMNLEKMINNPNSAISQIISGKQLVFWPDKQKAIENGEYSPNEHDRMHKNKGSIYCRNISIEKGNNKKIQAILNITTDDGLICDPEDEHTKNIFVNDIMPQFETLLQREITLLYITGEIGPKNGRVK